MFTDKYTQYRTYGIKRPPEYSQGEHGSVLHWMEYCIDKYQTMCYTVVENVCLLQPTSPLRTAEDINNAIDLFRNSDAHSLVSGYYMRIKTDSKIDSKNLDHHFQRNGAIFIFDKEVLKSGKLFDESSIKYEMPKSRSVDVDTQDDMEMAEAIIEYRRNKLCGML